MIRTYSELIKIPTFQERYEYLKLGDRVGRETFGFERYLNQEFYKTPEWKRLRNQIIVRDNACDMGLEGYALNNRIYIHHMNPVSMSDIVYRTDGMLDPENLICVSFETHNAIHYGSYEQIRPDPIERKPNDTKLW